jgi:flavin-binding protein dodecin
MKQTKTNELIGTSPHSFEDALKAILARANRTLRGVRRLDVLGKELDVSADGTLCYRVRAQLRFDMTPPDQLHW